MDEKNTSMIALLCSYDALQSYEETQTIQPEADDVTGTRKSLTQEMRKAGFSQAAIEAAWPTWWSDDADTSPSARAELRFVLARRLGLSPKPLLGERVEFFWDDSARFKHLKVHDVGERTAIASFGIAFGRELIAAAPDPMLQSWQTLNAQHLRDSILSHQPFVDLQSIISVCWSFGIPVVHIGIVPLERKSMHAMVVKHEGRYAILLARNARFPAEVAFTVAHELGHILYGHLGEAQALVDLEDPAETQDDDVQEQEADEFALNLLVGTTQLKFETDVDSFNAPTLADAVMRAAEKHQIEPGTMALTLAYQDGSWARTMSALGFIYGDIPPVFETMNAVAQGELNWNALSEGAADYLTRVMSGTDA